MVRRRWILATLAAGTLALSAATVRPGRWTAARLAQNVGRQLAAGDAAALAQEADTALRPFLGGGHLQAAALPIRGARLASVRLLDVEGASANATILYAGGREAIVRLTNTGVGRWQVSGLT